MPDAHAILRDIALEHMRDDGWTGTWFEPVKRATPTGAGMAAVAVGGAGRRGAPRLRRPAVADRRNAPEPTSAPVS